MSEPTPLPDADTDLHARLTALFEAVADLPDEERAARLSSLAAAEPVLAARLAALLDADRSTTSLLDQDAGALAEALESPEAPVLPPRVGRYAIGGYLGEGGMGAVYLARRDDLGDLVAVKFLRDTWSPAARARFALEERTLAGLTHRAIARLYDAGETDGRPWFAMEYVSGQDLLTYARSRSLDLAARLALFRDACEAVAYAHRHLVVHLDLKPSNILVTDEGEIKLVDFGVARHLDPAGDAVERTATGHRRLSMNYASPEQIRGEPLDVQSDVHGLGAVLYELLAGAPPVEFGGLSALDMAHALAVPPPRPSARAAARGHDAVQASKTEWHDLDAICLRAVHREKQTRYASAEALLGDLDRFGRSEPLAAHATTRPVYRLRKFVARNRRPLLVTAAVAAALVVIVTGFTLRLVAARDAAIAARVQLERIHGLMLNLFDGDEAAAGPASELRVTALLDRGVLEAEALDEDPVLQAELRSTFGQLYHRLGRLDRAGVLLTSAFEAQRQHLGAGHPQTLGTQLGLAQLRDTEADYDEAERLTRQVLELAAARRPPDPVELATARATLGTAFANRGDYAAARRELTAALEVLSSQPPSAALSDALGALANVAYYEGRVDEALALNTQGVALDRVLFGERHPQVAVNLYNLGNLALDRGDYAAAEALFRDANTIYEGWYGPQHARTGQTQMMLGRTLAYRQRPDEAAALYRRAHAIFSEAYGPRHLRVAAVRSVMGDLAREQRRFDEATAAFTEAAAMFTEVLGERHEFSLHQVSNLGSVHLARGAFGAAEPWLRRAVAGLTDVAPRSRYTGLARMRLAQALAGQGAVAEARDEAVAGYELLRELVGPAAAELVEARTTLADIHRALGEPEKAAALDPVSGAPRPTP